LCKPAGLGRHTVSLLNLKNKTSFPPLNYVTTLKRDKKGYTTEEEKQYGKYLQRSRSALFGRRRFSHALGKSPAPAGRVSFFTLIFQFSGTLETDGLAAAIRNDRSPLERYILKNKQIPGSPAWLCELVPVQ